MIINLIISIPFDSTQNNIINDHVHQLKIIIKQ